MDNSNDSKNKEESPVFKIIQEIKEEKREAKDLSKEQRQECVDSLDLQSYNISQIAQVLDRSEKTIRRDLQDVKTRRSVKPSLELATQIVGNMIAKLEAAQSYLMRLANSKEGSLQEKSQAIFYAGKMMLELTEKLQSLGYLPSAPQKVIGEIYLHNEDDDKTFAEAKEKLKEIEAIAKDTGVLDEATQKRIEDLKGKIEKAEIVKDVENLNKEQNNKKEEETKNE